MTRRRRSRRLKRGFNPPKITLTPLIDTALTLLIIFMVTTPMIQDAIRVDLPRGHVQEGGKQAQNLVVTIDKDEHIYVNNDEATLSTLEESVKNSLRLFAQPEGQRVWVKVDKVNQCEIFFDVMGIIKKIEGVKDVAIATQKAA